MLDVEAAAIESAPKCEENIFEVSAKERSNGSWTKTSLGPEPSWFCQTANIAVMHNRELQRTKLMGATDHQCQFTMLPSMYVYIYNMILFISILCSLYHNSYNHYIQCRSIDYTPYNARPRFRSITQDGWGREVLTASYRRPQLAGCGWPGVRTVRADSQCGLDKICGSQ